MKQHRITQCLLIISLFCIPLSISNPGQSAPFDSDTGIPAVAVLDLSGGGDYTSLSEASSAFSSVEGGINRPWTLLVNDGYYIEDHDSFFGQTFGERGSLTIKPATGAQPVIEFAATESHSTYDGQIIIGVPGDLNWEEPSANTTSDSNFTIDGSNRSRGRSRDMVFLSSANSRQSRLLRIMGDNDGVVIKNMVIEKNQTSTNIYTCIGLGIVNTESLGARTPDDCVIKNCELIALGDMIHGTGIQVKQIDGIEESGYAVKNIQVLGNSIRARETGISLYSVSDAIISNNDITILCNNQSYGCMGITHKDANGLSGWTQDISSNRISMSSSNHHYHSLHGITLHSSSEIASGTFYVYNNTIPKIEFTDLGTSMDSAYYRCIGVGNTHSHYYIYHNSIQMLPEPLITAVKPHEVAAIVAPFTMTTGSVTVKNNIIRGGSTGTYAALISSASSHHFISDGNDLYPVDSTNVGVIGANRYSTFSEWQTTGNDSNSISLDPLYSDSADSGVWDDSLHFTGDPGPEYQATPVGIEYDMDGYVRDASAPYIGADEPVFTPLTIMSSHGSPVPPVGTTNLPTGNLRSFTAFVNSPAHEELAEWTCMGYAGTGVVNSYGFINSVDIVPSSTEPSTLQWNWGVTGYFLDIQSDCGTVYVNDVTFTVGYFPANATLSIEVIPLDGYRFLSWSGDLEGQSSEQALLLDSPKSITANFIGPYTGHWRLY